MMTSIASVAPTIDRRFGPGSAVGFAERCDRSQSGAWVCTLEFATGTRWCEIHGETLRELDLADDRELPGARWLSGCAREGTAEVVSWRPGRRVVARTKDARGTEIAKGYRRGRAQKAAEKHRAITASSSRDAFFVPALLSEDTKLELVRFECFAGRTLDPLGSRSVLVDAGQRLAHFQRGAVPDHFAAHVWKDEIAALERIAEAWQADVGELPAGWSAQLERLRGAPPTAALPMTCAHGDLHDGQILVGERGLALIDLDLARLAEPTLDLGNLCAHVHLCELKRTRRLPGAAAQAAEDALLAGYHAADGSRSPAALARYKSATALRLALVYGIRPRWSDLAEPLVSVSSRFWREV
jgi:hypothetical protein